jgi:hypothetical protein
MNRVNATRLARYMLLAFVTLFVLSRIIVYANMAHLFPTSYVYIGGVHVHHFIFGTLIMLIAGCYLIFRQPTGRELCWTAFVFACGMVLTFDEFGMMLHLGGGYYQQISVDALVILISLIMIALASRTLVRRGVDNRWEWLGIFVLFFIITAGLVLSVRKLTDDLQPALDKLDQQSPK